MINLTAIVLTNNNEKILDDCLNSLSFCDEIVVIDDYSKDNTIKIAQKRKCRVFKRKLANDFATQRNFALSKARGEWVLFVDSDERIDSRLREEILESIKNNMFDGYLFKRVNYYQDKVVRHGEIGATKLLRLAKKTKGKWRRNVHETWVVVGKIGNLDNPIMHCPDYTISNTLEKIDRYSSLHAMSNMKEGKQSSGTKIVVLPIAKFVYNYFFRLGFLDGTSGFVIALTMSFHSYLSWSKLWFYQKNLTLQQ